MSVRFAVLVIFVAGLSGCAGGQTRMTAESGLPTAFDLAGTWDQEAQLLGIEAGQLSQPLLDDGRVYAPDTLGVWGGALDGTSDSWAYLFQGKTRTSAYDAQPMFLVGVTHGEVTYAGASLDSRLSCQAPATSRMPEPKVTAAQAVDRVGGPALPDRWYLCLEKPMYGQRSYWEISWQTSGTSGPLERRYVDAQTGELRTAAEFSEDIRPKPITWT